MQNTLGCCGLRYIKKMQYTKIYPHETYRKEKSKVEFYVEM